MMAPQTPKELLDALTTPLMGLEANFKKPFVAAGLPDIPTPLEMVSKMTATLPELPGLETFIPAFAPPAKRPPAAVEEEVVPRLIVRYG